MNLLKKLALKVSIVVAIVAMIATPVSAQPNSSKSVSVQPNLSNTVELEATVDISNIELGEKVVLPDGAVLTPITQEEYISRLAAEKNISFQKAYSMELKDSEYQILSGTTYYYDYVKRFTYSRNSSFKADLEATIKIYTDGSFRQIDDVLDVASRRAAGVYDNDWIETSAYSDPDQGSDEFPVTSVTLGAKGYFEVRTTFELNVSVDLPGFSAGGGSGGEFIYQSETMSMRSTYSVY